MLVSCVAKLKTQTPANNSNMYCPCPMCCDVKLPVLLFGVGMCMREPPQSSKRLCEAASLEEAELLLGLTQLGPLSAGAGRCSTEGGLEKCLSCWVKTFEAEGPSKTGPRKSRPGGGPTEARFNGDELFLTGSNRRESSSDGFLCVSM